MAIRLVLVDDHPIVLQGLEQLFERHDDFEVLSCCADGASALSAVAKYQPDVLVMDLRKHIHDAHGVPRDTLDKGSVLYDHLAFRVLGRHLSDHGS